MTFFGLDQQIRRSLELLGVNAVKIISQIQQGDAHHFPHRVDECKRSRVLFGIENNGPALRIGIFDAILAVHQAHGTPLPAGGILVARIESSLPEFAAQIFQVGKFGMIQRLDQLQVDQAGHDVV